MKYADARPAIKSGDVLALTHAGWGSLYDLQVQAVRAFTRSEYCHVGIAWVAGERVFVIESVVPQIRIFPLSLLRPFYWLPAPRNYWSHSTEEFAMSHVGEPYSKWQAVAAFLGALKPGADARWQCAEFVNAVLERAALIPPGVPAVPSHTVAALQTRDWPIHFVE